MSLGLDSSVSSSESFFANASQTSPLSGFKQTAFLTSSSDMVLPASFSAEILTSAIFSATLTIEFDGNASDCGRIKVALSSISTSLSLIDFCGSSLIKDDGRSLASASVFEPSASIDAATSEPAVRLNPSSICKSPCTKHAPILPPPVRC